VLDEHRRITRYDGAVRNMAEFIDNANGCLLHRNVETNVMGLRHGMAPMKIGPAIVLQMRSRRAPNYPI